MESQWKRISNFPCYVGFLGVLGKAWQTNSIESHSYLAVCCMESRVSAHNKCLLLHLIVTEIKNPKSIIQWEECWALSLAINSIVNAAINPWINQSCIWSIKWETVICSSPYLSLTSAGILYESQMIHCLWKQFQRLKGMDFSFLPPPLIVSITLSFLCSTFRV